MSKRWWVLWCMWYLLLIRLCLLVALVGHNTYCNIILATVENIKKLEYSGRNLLIGRCCMYWQLIESGWHHELIHDDSNSSPLNHEWRPIFLMSQESTHNMNGHFYMTRITEFDSIHNLLTQLLQVQTNILFFRRKYRRTYYPGGSYALRWGGVVWCPRMEL